MMHSKLAPEQTIRRRTPVTFRACWCGGHPSEFRSGKHVQGKPKRTSTKLFKHFRLESKRLSLSSFNNSFGHHKRWVCSVLLVLSVEDALVESRRGQHEDEAVTALWMALYLTLESDEITAHSSMINCPSSPITGKSFRPFSLLNEVTFSLTHSWSGSLVSS